jgi:polysaccharide export outer membrane protein
MTNAPTQVYTDHMQVLFGVGTCAGLTDGQLLERFMAGQNEPGDLAFETLVTRHGPMVMRVCRNVLDDPHDVHDAYQAVFLVLARRANAIRNRQAIGSWLYGVAVRVSARAKVTAIRRHIRDKRTMGAAQAIAAVVPNQDDASPIERNDRAQAVHQELSRLPEKYRAPVVLCYLEGLTHDEAAARLSWPVGTVRSRLARGRDRLRNRLTRRGVSAPASVGPMACWLVGEPGASTELIATVSAGSSAPISRELLMSIARAVGRATGATSVPSTSLLLAQGVLNTMLLKKRKAVSRSTASSMRANSSRSPNCGLPRLTPIASPSSNDMSVGSRRSRTERRPSWNSGEERSPTCRKPTNGVWMRS